MYFENCKTAEELKKEYFRLAMIYHPDRANGKLETMQVINDEYDKAFKILKDIHTNAKGESYKATKETEETAEQYPDIISKIIHFIGVNIEICGSWVWLSGDTKTYKEQIKEIGFKWSKNKIMWYWRAEENRTFYNRKSHDMEYIRGIYGSQTIANRPLEQIA